MAPTKHSLCSITDRREAESLTFNFLLHRPNPWPPSAFRMPPPQKGASDFGRLFDHPDHSPLSLSLSPLVIPLRFQKGYRQLNYHKTSR
ncbi:hypothetical protein DACRYDRAFT_21633 [Dacryopinax primogenitus]|uniref:Uncharacterized protein n=1 Tax=Dacryopinax primogenitus (strain DJM 731) TaxID=1858805 RepID=M5FX50_DACPD|nr:uncharacterized protein DACRYDRAFT_21633 [Dacryopinax primogenitus]EJU02561.1 hypothetical protein DACRYDRAFT_21633 [Dacryopinax primogenitus]